MRGGRTTGMTISGINAGTDWWADCRVISSYSFFSPQFALDQAPSVCRVV